MKTYEIIYEVVKQYRVEVEAETEALAREKWEQGQFNQEDIEDMQDVAPYDNYNNNKNIVDVNQIN